MKTKTYSEIFNISDPKEKTFACSERIDELRTIKSLYGLNKTQDIELSNLNKLIMDAYSDWKD